MEPSSRARPHHPRNIRYLDDTLQSRLVVGAFCALVLMAITPGLQALFRSRPFQFLGHISFSLYIWHLTIIFSLGSFTFYALYVKKQWAYGEAVGAAAAAVLTAAIFVAYVATKLFDEPAIDFTKWMFKALFTPKDDKIRVHRALRRLER